MATNPEKPDFKKQFRAMVQGSQSLTVAYIGVVNDLFAPLKRLGTGDVAAMATTAHMDTGYVRRLGRRGLRLWLSRCRRRSLPFERNGRGHVARCAGHPYAFVDDHGFERSMAVRAASLMRSGECPGETVMAEVETFLPWFGAMLEGALARFLEEKICPGVPIFAEIDKRSGLVVDLGCGNG